MPKTRQQKEEALNTLVQKFADAKSAVFVSFSGLNVTSAQEFRKACREQGLDYIVAKKTLLKLALEKNNLSEVDVMQYQQGMGVVVGSADEVAPAQVVHGFTKENESMTILGGFMADSPEGDRYLNQDAVMALAKLPSKEVLLGQLVGSLKSPISGFANVLSGNLRGLVQVLNAVKEQKEA